MVPRNEGQAGSVTIVVLVFLAILWAAVLVPPYLRSRAEARPADSIVSFRQQLAVLERTTPGRTARAVSPQPEPLRAAPTLLEPPRSAEEARRRRVLVIESLAVLAAVTLLAQLAIGGLLVVHVAVDALLGGAVWLNVQRQRISRERAAKVRYLHPVRAGAPAPALLRRAAQ